jgi:hypothetical protein
MELENKTSSGLDKLPTILIKKLSLELSQFLKILFQRSLNCTFIPDDWKISIISPVPKISNPTKPVDYRPISLTSSICRVMESLILDKLVEYCEAQNLFSSNQHGFLKKKSTVTCLYECLDCWSLGFEKGYAIDVLYIDISKAFDSIIHNKLISRLKHIGIDGLILKWIANWLIGRKQLVKVNDSLSSPCPVRSGVPQGSVLGPFLFILYMSSLDSHLKLCSLKYYADDCKIFMRVKNEQEAITFQNEIDSIIEWADQVQLKLAFNKCFILHLNPRISLNYKYTMKDVEIMKKDVIRDLGIMIDDKLTFEEHITLMIKKAGLVSNIILHNFKCRDLNFLSIAFKAFVRPILEYGNEIFHPKLIKDIARIELVQRQFTRRISSLRDKEYPSRLKALDLESLELRRIRAGLTFIYKMRHGLVKVSNRITEMPQRNRRAHGQQLHIEVMKTKQRQSLIFSLVNIWNKLKNETVESTDLLTFKKALLKENLTEYALYKDCFC